MTLEEKCLNCIIKNFGYFNAIFKNSEDDSVLNNLELLRRGHSDLIIRELYERHGFIKECYIEFLINEYLKELDMKILNYCSKQAILARISIMGHKLLKVTYEHHMLPPHELELFINAVVQHLKNVTILRIPFICNDETLRIVSLACTDLLELDIHGCRKITVDGLKRLCMDESGRIHHRSKLRHLDVDVSERYDEAISFLLTNIPTLEFVNYRQLPKVIHTLHKWNFTIVTHRYNLTSLNFMDLYNSMYLSEVLTVCARLCPKVRKLSIPICLDKHLEQCGLFNDLERLTMEGSYKVKPYKCLNDLLKIRGHNLRALGATCLTISVPVLVHSCPKLQSLNLKNVVFQSFSEDVKILSELTDFSLDDFNFSDAFVAMSVLMIIKNSPRLVDLAISHCKLLTSDAYRRLFNVCPKSNLKNLDLSFSDVQVDVIREVLMSCPSLQSINLEYCEKLNHHQHEQLCAFAHTLKNKPVIMWNDHVNGLDYSLYNDNVFDVGQNSDDSFAENDFNHENEFQLVE